MELILPGPLWSAADTGQGYGEESPVTIDINQQSSPDISGDIVVWADYRPVDGDMTGGHIFYKDISSAGQEDAPEQVLTPGMRFQGSPAISGDLIVWSQQVSTPSGGVGYQIYYKYINGPGPLPVSTASYQQFRPAVSGDRIVWEDNRAGSKNTDIYMYDLERGEELAVSVESSRQEQPSIDGDWVVWMDNREGTYLYGTPTKNDLYAKNMVTGEERRLTFDEKSGLQGHPSISGDRVVYHEKSDDGYREDVMIQNLSTGESRQIFSSGGRDVYPEIDGDSIVWQTCPVPGNTECRIYAHDLSTQITLPLTPGEYNAGGVAVSSGIAVWDDGRNGNSDIYRNRLGDPAMFLAMKFRPELHFKHDILAPWRLDFEPRSVELLVDIDGSSLSTPDGDIEEPSLETLAQNADGGNFLDLPGSPMNPFDDYQNAYLSHLAANEGEYPLTAYARVIPDAEESGKAVIQYWFCYFYNDFYNDHEGDWEMVEVVLDKDLAPQAAVYSQHGIANKKYWVEPGLEKDGDHPKVYVAAGSHANYFSNGVSGRHYHEGKVDVTGDTSSSSPSLDVQALAEQEGWAGYAGRWGEHNSWWPPVWLPPFIEGGPPGPKFQGGGPDDHTDPWYWPLSWADISVEKGDDNDLVIEAFSSVTMHLYDLQGNHVGVNSSGGIDTEIAGSEYYERDEDGSINIVIKESSLAQGYRLELIGQEAESLELKVRAPNLSGNVIVQNEYSGIQVDTGTKAFLEINSDMAGLMVDSDEDGVYESEFLPAASESLEVDFTPPPPVTDLAVIDAGSNSVTLSWTGGGIDENDISRYEVRYSQFPITEDNWEYIRQADSVNQGITQDGTISTIIEGLDGGAIYYFAVRARDDSWQLSDLSNETVITTGRVDLSWSKQNVYWAGWNDYRGRLLSVDYEIANIGGEPANAIAILASYCSPYNIQAASQMPLKVRNLTPGEFEQVTLKYLLPVGINKFTTRTYASCKDESGQMYLFPGPLPE